MRKVISLEQAIKETYSEKEKQILKDLLDKFIKKYDDSISLKEQKLLKLAQDLNLGAEVLKTLEKNLNNGGVEIRGGKWVIASIKRFLACMK